MGGAECLCSMHVHMYTGIRGHSHGGNPPTLRSWLCPFELWEDEILALCR